LGAEFHVYLFRESRVLLDGEIPVLDAGAATDGSLGGAERSECRGRKGVRVKRVKTWLTIHARRAAGSVGAESVMARIAGGEVPGEVRLAGKLEVEAILKLLIVG